MDCSNGTVRHPFRRAVSRNDARMITPDITAPTMIAWTEPSPSSPAPAARRCAASGLDRSVRPSRIVGHAFDAVTQCRNYQLPPSQKSLTQNFGHSPNDRRPEFQRMIEAGTSRPAPFDIVIVHSFSRFFRDHFELEFYVRKLAKNGVRLVSIAQEMGDDPMHVMMRQIMALFDEYQSKENAKHVLRALKENARQGFWNGSLPPIGYRVVAAEQRGAKVKKKLEIDPLHADTVRLISRLALEGDGTSGPMGVKNIAAATEPKPMPSAQPRCWSRQPTRPSHRKWSRSSPERQGSASGSMAVAIVATISALWPSASRSRTERSASSARKAT